MLPAQDSAGVISGNDSETGVERLEKAANRAVVAARLLKEFVVAITTR